MSSASSPAVVLVCRSGAALLLAVAAAVQAQPLDAPPKLAPGTAVASPARAERAPETPSTGPITEDEVLADLAPTRSAPPQTRIEQRRQGNRIVELTVTPAGSNRSYLIVNREGQRPLSVQELSAGLSTPRFIKFDF